MCGENEVRTNITEMRLHQVHLTCLLQPFNILGYTQIQDGKILFFLSSFQLEDTNPWGSCRLWRCPPSHSPFSGHFSVREFLNEMWQSKFNSAAGQLFTASLSTAEQRGGRQRILPGCTTGRHQAICISQLLSQAALRPWHMSPQQLNWAWAVTKH